MRRIGRMLMEEDFKKHIEIVHKREEKQIEVDGKDRREEIRIREL